MKQFNFDGKGINGGDEYMSRIATLTEHGHSLAVGRLFAAAPELLAALESVVKSLEMWPGEKNPEFFPSMKAARAVIAKVKGK